MRICPIIGTCNWQVERVTFGLTTMATFSHDARRRVTGGELASWGSAGVARSGDVVLELDEGLGHREETWQLSIDTPLVYVTAQFNNVSQLRNILRYLE